MLSVVVAVFAVLWLPYRGMLVYNSFATMFNRPPFMDLWFLMFAKTCVYINSAINPILYNAMSTKFRKAFQRVLICRGGSRAKRQNGFGGGAVSASSTVADIRGEQATRLTRGGRSAIRDTQF